MLVLLHRNITILVMDICESNCHTHSPWSPWLYSPEQNTHCQTVLSLHLHYMWPDLRKTTFHAHNNNTHFSSSNNSCTRWLTIQLGIDAESCPSYFCCGLFLRLIRCPRVLGLLSNGSVSPWQADSWLYFTTQLAYEFSHGFSYFVWYCMWRWKWQHIFSVDVALPATSWLPARPHPSTQEEY